jgi:NSS family neurotransmitter:Na+ symporter
MPILLFLVVGIAIYSLSISHTNEMGVTTTGSDGFLVYVVPDFEGVTVKSFLVTVMDALGQLFYSISVAMGIMIAYGSYVPDESNLVKSVNQIEIFDTVVAFLAGAMIIPAIYVFEGTEGMQQGPSLMFVALPKIFSKMGAFGNVVGVLFFGMVLFAAITSAMSILEAVVSSLIDKFHWKRSSATALESLVAMAIGAIVCFGYNILYFEIKLPNGNTAQILDILDYVSNNILMPVVALATCILVGWILKPMVVLEEATKNGEKIFRGKLYKVMVKFIAPALLLFLLLLAFGVFG